MLDKFTAVFGTRSFGPFSQELSTTVAALAAIIIIIIIIIITNLILKFEVCMCELNLFIYSQDLSI